MKRMLLVVVLEALLYFFWIAFPALFPLQILVVFNCSDFTQFFVVALLSFSL